MQTEAEPIEWATFDILPGYAVNTLGEIFNTRKKRYLTPSLNDNQFVRVCIRINQRQRQFYIHKLVAMAFLDDYQDGYEVLFKDGDKQNCRADNLYMGSRRARRTEDGLW